MRGILAVQGLQHQGRHAADQTQHQLAHLDFLLRLAYGRHAVDAFRLDARFAAVRVDALRQVAQHEVGDQHETRADRRFQRKPQAAQDADGGRAPQGGGRVQSPHRHAFAHDDAGAQKADARHHLRGDAHVARGIAFEHGNHHEQRGADGYQRVRAQARHALAQLAFGADHGAQGQCRGNAQRKVKYHHQFLPAGEEQASAGAKSIRPERGQQTITVER
ncbi:hypothetical protein D3C72_1308680 [compost metagenome]